MSTETTPQSVNLNDLDWKPTGFCDGSYSSYGNTYEDTTYGMKMYVWRHPKGIKGKGAPCDETYVWFPTLKRKCTNQQECLDALIELGKLPPGTTIDRSKKE